MDDTLNNFSETLLSPPFAYSDVYRVTPENFARYICMVRENVIDVDGLLSNEYATFRYKIHEQCYAAAKARTDGVEFMQWLRNKDWTIVVCTYRDLRRATDCTKAWLKDNNIPFDYLFYSQNKVVFCNLWGIKYLIDDDDFNIAHGKRYGVDVFYPIMDKHKNVVEDTARGFITYDEVKQWIEE